MFKFADNDSKTFQYSRGEWDDHSQQFKTIYGDPARLRRQLSIAIPNRAAMIGQYLAGAAIVRAKDADVAAYEAQRLADPTLPAKEFTFTEEELAAITAGGTAFLNLCAGIRAAFGLVPFDEQTGRGATDAMCVHVLNQFTTWLEEN